MYLFSCWLLIKHVMCSNAHPCWWDLMALIHGDVCHLLILFQPIELIRCWFNSSLISWLASSLWNSWLHAYLITMIELIVLVTSWPGFDLIDQTPDWHWCWPMLDEPIDVICWCWFLDLCPLRHQPMPHGWGFLIRPNETQWEPDGIPQQSSNHIR